MQVKNILAAAAVAALGFGVVNAQAATTTSQFTVQLKITSACAVSTAPGNIDLGSAVASTTAITNNGSTTFKVNCSNKTPFYIGLAPSNGSTEGAGVMSAAAAGITDKVPYTLYSNAGLTTVWGNTATSSAVGNGMSGTGGGMAASKAVSFTAYAQATNSDFAPATYTDTVTVNVNY